MLYVQANKWKFANEDVMCIDIGDEKKKEKIQKKTEYIE